MPTAAALLLLLCLPAAAATGWSGRQTTTPIDRPGDEGASAEPALAAAVSAERAPPLGFDNSTTATADRWGLTIRTTDTNAPPTPTGPVAETWGVPDPEPEVAPPPPPEPSGPPPGPINRATDYTAYTLELGEVRLGLAEVGIGVAPRVQLATTPLWYALGAWNLKTKADIFRAGPWDMALVGNVNGLTEGRDFQAIWTRVGMIHSFQAGKRVGIHVGGGWDHIFAMGLPSEEALRPFVWTPQRREAYDAWYATAVASDARLEANQNLVTARLALDLKLTHRDAIVAQASGIAFGDSRSAVTATVDGELVDLPPVLGLDKILIDEPDPGNALANSWIAGLAYQATFRHLQVRIGGGWSAQTWAWVPATFDLSWRFGGRSRKLIPRDAPQGPGPGTPVRASPTPG